MKLALKYDSEDGFYLAFSCGKDSQAIYKQAKQDGYDENIAEYVSAQVHQAFEVGWRSALQSSINLLNKLKID